MTTIYTFAQSAIEEAQNAGRYGTANLYTSAIKSFRKFTGDRPLTFKELTPGLIKKYEESLLQKGRRHNTISAYMRMLRSIFNQAYVQGIPDADILRRYTNKHSQSPYLLPILSSTGSEGYRQYKSALRLYNQHLHQLSKMLHLNVPLTSYVARHSWATTAKEEGVAIAMISEGLGHSSEKVTNVYLASFNNNAMSKANRKVISRIYPKKKKKR